LITFLKHDGGQVGIYDGSNTDPRRRQAVYEKLTAENIQVLFIEVICDKREIIEGNIRQVKLNSPDYQNMPSDLAVTDFLKRIEGYMAEYKTIEDRSLAYVKLVNVGDQIIVNAVKGYLMTRIVYYLMNLHIVPRKIYLVRNGQTINESAARRDAPLSPHGENFARRLPMFLNDLRTHEQANPSSVPVTPSHSPKLGYQRTLKIWTSPRQRSAGTARHFHECYTAAPFVIEQKWNLVEMNPGVVDNLSDTEIREKYPEDHCRWMKDPYHYRYPRAESYHDVAIRLEEILLELEREKDDVLIIAHESILKCLYAYLMDRSEKEIPTELQIPQNVILELTPVAYGCAEKRYSVELSI
jgi:6-phosphofructo-2-kinase/fructose-2,6-biphosphatase 4